MLRVPFDNDEIFFVPFKLRFWPNLRVQLKLVNVIVLSACSSSFWLPLWFTWLPNPPHTNPSLPTHRHLAESHTNT